MYDRLISLYIKLLTNKATLLEIDHFLTCDLISCEITGFFSGKKYARSRRRRQSKEFEDLNLDTESGTLSHIEEHAEEDFPLRQRVYSMSYAQKIMAGTHFNSNHSSPRASPDIRRKLLKKNSGRGGNSSGSSKESLSDSAERITSLENLHWIGNPEAIHSVRRPRKKAEELELESEIHKLSVK